VRYELSDSFDHAELKLSYELSDLEPVLLKWTLLDQVGNCVFEKGYTVQEKNGVLKAELENPELWWPNGQGDQVLYLSKLELLDLHKNCMHEKEQRVGFRRVRLVMHPGAWEHPDSFPKSRSNPPITMEVNGRQIFCKGSNWVNPEIFPGIINRDTYRPLVEMARAAHMNLFRVWGGGIVNKEAFFDLCDELGMMVWQEFPLACNNYLNGEPYLKVLDQESKSIIRRVRRHTCLVMWCGGNELFNA